MRCESPADEGVWAMKGKDGLKELIMWSGCGGEVGADGRDHGQQGPHEQKARPRCWNWSRRLRAEMRSDGAECRREWRSLLAY